MPRLVVPIAPAPAAFSRSASSSRCIGKDKGCVLRNPQLLRGNRNAKPGEFGDFFVERPGVDDNAVTDHGKLAANHAGRQKRSL